MPSAAGPSAASTLPSVRNPAAYSGRSLISDCLYPLTKSIALLPA
jgi:hypothetical protein